MNELKVCKNDSTRLEMHYVDTHVSQFNASPSFLIKNHFAQYFQDIFIKPTVSKENDQQAFMTKLYTLVLSFESLERFVANPSTPDPMQAKDTLIKTIESWQEAFINQLNLLAIDKRSSKLIKELSAQIKYRSAAFLQDLKEEDNINLRHIFAGHDLGNETSLGHFIASNLDCLLVTGLKLAYHHSPYSILNLFYVDRAIATLSDAKKDLNMQNFSLEGHVKTTAVHPYSHTMLDRLNPQKSEFEFFSYPIPQNNPSAAERLLRIKDNYNHPSTPLYQSSWWQFEIKVVFSIVDLVFLNLIILHFLNYVIVNVLNLITFKYFEASLRHFFQSCQSLANSIYTFLSPLHYFQSYENQLIQAHWKKYYPEADMHILEASLVKQNYLQKLLNDFHFRESKLPIKSVVFKKLQQEYLSQICIAPPTKQKINHLHYQSENHFTSGIEMMGEIILLLDNYAVEACFRKAPIISTTGFCASLLTLTAYVNPGLIIPGTNLAISQLQHLINQINLAFCGKVANTALPDEIIGIFLTWQLNGLILDIPVSLLQERLGWTEDSKHETSKLITQITLLAALAYGVGQLHPIDINWDKLSCLGFLNETGKYAIGPLLDFINLMIEESHTCCDGTFILANTSQMVITLKGLLILKNWLSGYEQHYLEQTIPLEPTHAVTPIEDSFIKEDKHLKLKQYLQALANHDLTLLEASKQVQFAQDFYLDLKKELQQYNEDHKYKIDGQILLDNYFNLYCQSHYLNFCKLLILPYIVLSVLECIRGYGYHAIFSNPEESTRREIYLIRVRKHLDSALLIFIQSIYYALHMLATFIKVVWNYVLIGSIRALTTLIGEVCVVGESLYTKSSLKDTQSYLGLCQIDDTISNYKIRHQVNQILQPIYSITASLAQSTGIFEDTGPIAQRLLKDIITQDKIAESRLQAIAS